METDDVSRWFDGYLEVFAACGRGEREASALLAYYGVPLLVTLDDVSFTLTSDDQVVGMLQRQIDEMRAGGYARTETVSSEITPLNGTSALHRATYSRLDGEGGEIGRVTATYLVADGSVGRRISVLAVH